MLGEARARPPDALPHLVNLTLSLQHFVFVVLLNFKCKI
jgi:hypothetical protein